MLSSALSGPCPEGSHYFTNCSNPCLVPDSESTQCKSSPEALCQPDYCGGCIARFFDIAGKEIHCEEGNQYQYTIVTTSEIAMGLLFARQKSLDASNKICYPTVRMHKLTGVFTCCVRC